MDHFVKSSDSLFFASEKGLLHRNFQGYCTRATTGQVYAFGVTAISQLAAAYSQNIRGVQEYIDKASQGELPVMRGYVLNEQEQLAREVITTFMCNNRLNWKELSLHIGIPVDEIMARLAFNRHKLEEMADDGLSTYS